MKTTEKTITMKGGLVIEKGTEVNITPAMLKNGRKCHPSLCTLEYKGQRYGVRYTSVFGEPSIEDIQEMVMDGNCTTPSGDTVEPDGHDSHGFPSWLIIFGMC